MANNPLNHSIRRFLMDVAMDDKDKAFDMQTELARIYHAKLERITERLFDEYQVPGHIFRIKALEIDLGDISKAYLEEEVVTKYESALKEALISLKADATYKLNYLDRNAELIPLTPIKRDVVRYFLIKGRMLSTAANFPGKIHNLFEELVSDAPDQALAMLLDLIERYPEAIRRFVEQFPRPSIVRAFRLLSPSYHDYVETEIQNLALAIHRYRPEVSIERITADLRQSSIEFLGKNQRQIFSKVRFLRAVRRKMERNLNESLFEAFPPEAVPEQERVAQNLEEAYSEQLQTVMAFLRGDTASLPSTAELQGAWDTLVRNNIQGLRQVLLPQLNQVKPIFDLAGALPSERIHSFVMQSRPAVAQELIRVMVRLISQHSQYLLGQSADKTFRDLVYAHLLRYSLEAAPNKQNPASLAVYMKRVLASTPGVPSQLIEDWDERIKRPQDPTFEDSAAQAAEQAKRAEEKAEAEREAADEEAVEAEKKAAEEQAEELKAAEKQAAEEKAAGEKAAEEQAAEEQAAEEAKTEAEAAREAEEAKEKSVEAETEKKAAELAAEEQAAREVEEQRVKEEAEKTAEEKAKEEAEAEEAKEAAAEAEAAEEGKEGEVWEPLETESEKEWEEKRAEAEKAKREQALADETASETEAEQAAEQETEAAVEEPGTEAEKAPESERIDLDQIQEAAEAELDPEQSQIDFVLYLIKTGEQPWWGKNLKDPDPISILAKLTDSKEFRQAFEKMVRDLATEDRPQTVINILRNFGEAGVTAFLEKAVPNIYGFLATVAKALGYYADAKHPIPQNTEFRTQYEWKWFYILRFYFDYINQIPSPQEFIHYLVQMIAASTPQSEMEVLTKLRIIAFQANKRGEQRFLPMVTLLPKNIDDFAPLEERGKPSITYEVNVYAEAELARLKQEAAEKAAAEAKAKAEEAAEAGEVEEPETQAETSLDSKEEVEAPAEQEAKAAEKEAEEVEPRSEAEKAAEEPGEMETTATEEEAAADKTVDPVESELTPEEKAAAEKAKAEEAKKDPTATEAAEREAEKKAAEAKETTSEERIEEQVGEKGQEKAAEDSPVSETEEEKAAKELADAIEVEGESGAEEKTALEAAEEMTPEAEAKAKAEAAELEAEQAKQTEEEAAELPKVESEEPAAEETQTAELTEAERRAAEREAMADEMADAIAEMEEDEAELELAEEGDAPALERPGMEAEPLSEEAVELEDPVVRNEVIEYFLLQGTLPNRYDTLSEAQVMELLMDFAKEMPRQMVKIIKENAHIPVARLRWASFSEEVTEYMLLLLLPDLQRRHFHAYLVLLREVFSQPGAPMPVSALTDHAFEYFSEATASDYRMDEYVRSLLKKVDRDSAFSAVWTIEWIVQVLANKTSPIGLSFREVLIAIRREYEPLADTEQADGPEQSLVPEEEVQKRAIPEPEPEDDPTIYINNAGLAVVFALLPSIFKSMEFLNDKGDFINDAVRERAIHFLAYLTHQQEKTPEEELVLNKILIGWPIERSIMKNVPLSEAEKQVAEEVITEIIDKWPGMEGTNNMSFRKSWFQRDGRLEPDSTETWVLRVDQRGFDMLLDKLPWRYGKFEAPWAKDTIRVEWR